MARVLVVPGGCRGRSLAASLRADGHAVRATSRREAARTEIEGVGAEFFRGDPDRIGTLTAALDNTTILCWLLGSAQGSPDSLAALHGSRLSMLLERTIDTTVRGVVYEASGSVAPDLLARGADAVARACAYSEIPFRVLRADPADHGAWLGAARVAVDDLLGL